MSRMRRNVTPVRRPCAGQRGSATAEFAAAIPAVLIVLGCCLGGVQLATQQLRLHDAAATAAQAAARGETTATIQGRTSALVHGAHTSLERRGTLVCATVTGSAAPGGGILSAVSLSASACALEG